MTVESIRDTTGRLLRRVVGLIQETTLAFRADRAQVMSAALVYYGALSVVPLLVMLAAVPGLLLRFSATPQAVAGDILGFAETAFGPEFRALLERSLNDLQRDSLIASLIAFGALLFAASLIFRHISRCFRFIWQGVSAAENLGDVMRHSMLAKLIDRVIGFVMVLALGIVVLVSTVISALIPLLQRLFSFLPWFDDFASWVVTPATGFGLIMVFFLLMYKFLPPVKMGWRDVWVPALLCALGWELAKQVLVIYISVVGGSSSYGAMSVLMALLVWFYYNGMILFFCAELCKVHAQDSHRLW
jgi:membrane protein